MSHVHFDAESALEFALAPVSDPRRASLATCVECRAALERAERELATLRPTFASSASNVRLERVIARALAATTREDLSWRGTARVWTNFARTRLRNSASLRWLAASVCANLLALGALVAWSLRHRAASDDIVLDERAAPRLEPRELVEPPRVASAPQPRHPTDLAVENALASDRVSLDRTLRSPTFAGTPAVRRAGELLACRVERWRGETCSARTPEVDASGVEAVLWTDILLDDFVRGEYSGGELAVWLSTCRRIAATHRPEAELARRVVARAARYGILADSTVAARTAPQARALDKAWFDALASAVTAASAEDDPTVRAWLAWGGPKPTSR
ncbi:MAG: hypothetical protein K8S98_12340 [Planctomycetes bacterium]|nr:hypothetical protein [Planctomycetota bacterium]